MIDPIKNYMNNLTPPEYEGEQTRLITIPNATILPPPEGTKPKTSFFSKIISWLFNNEKHTRQEDSLKKSPNKDEEPSNYTNLKAPKVGEYAIAIFDCTYNCTNFLNLKAMEKVLIKSEKDDNFFVQSDQNRASGLVKKVHLINLEQSYITSAFYFHHMSRYEAELCLSRCHIVGSYLVRPQRFSNEDLSLSILSKNFQVRHYHINVARSHKIPQKVVYQIQDEISFGSLKKLLCYYLKNCKFFEVPSITPIPVEFTYNFQIDLHCKASLKGTIKECTSERIPLSMKGCIGHGNFGIVRKAYLPGGQAVAVKFLKRDEAESKINFIREASILNKLNHPKILSLGAFCSLKDGETIIITEYMSRGSLLHYLKSSDGLLLTPYNMLYIAYQVSHGAQYLQSLHVIHRDISARNILVGDSYRDVKISDFGLAYFELESNEVLKQNTSVNINEDADDIKNIRVALRWAAPESLNFAIFSSKSDVWSFGIFMFELFSFGDIPYSSMSSQQVVSAVNKGYRLERPMICPLAIYQIMEYCWTSMPEERPCFNKITKRIKHVSRTLYPSDLKPATVPATVTS